MTSVVNNTGVDLHDPQGNAATVTVKDASGADKIAAAVVMVDANGEVSTLELGAASLAALENITVGGTVALDSASLAALEHVSIDSIALPAGAATEATLAGVGTSLGTDGAAPPSIAGTGVRGWLRGAFEKLEAIRAVLAGTLTVQGTVGISGTVAANTGLAQPLTDTQLRAAAVPVSGTVALDAPSLAALENINVGNFPATQPVSAAALPLPAGAATETTLAGINGKLPELSGGRIPVSLPPGGSGLTDLELRASPVPVSLDAADGTQLYSGTLNTVGAGTQLDTTGFHSVAIQASGVGTYTCYFEGSNDGTAWDELMFLPLDDFSLRDTIVMPGNYSLKTSTKYIRYSIQQITGNLTLNIVGRATAGPSAAENLSMALSSEQNMPLGVSLKDGLKTDANKALVLSDGVQYNYSALTGSNEPLTIDCTGYQSLSVHLTAGSATVSASNDGVNWVTRYVFPSGSGALPASSISSGTIGLIPISSKFYRITPTGFPANASIVLKTGSVIPQELYNGYGVTNITHVNGTLVTAGQLPVSLANINGIATVTGGVAGLLAVGGNTPIGVGPTSYPVLTGGVDPSGLARRVLTDSYGRIQTTSVGVDQANIQRQLGVISPTYQNQPAQNVQDTSQFEGASQIELLAQILLELKILNQQMFSIPLLLNSGAVNADEPSAFRSDPTIFNQ